MKRPLPRVYYNAEIVFSAARTDLVTGVRGYIMTAHRAALKLMQWEGGTGYRLRRVRDSKVVALRGSVA